MGCPACGGLSLIDASAFEGSALTAGCLPIMERRVRHCRRTHYVSQAPYCLSGSDVPVILGHVAARGLHR